MAVLPLILDFNGLTGAELELIAKTLCRLWLGTWETLTEDQKRNWRLKAAQFQDKMQEEANKIKEGRSIAATHARH